MSDVAYKESTTLKNRRVGSFAEVVGWHCFGVNHCWSDDSVFDEITNEMMSYIDMLGPGVHSGLFAEEDVTVVVIEDSSRKHPNWRRRNHLHREDV